ncbi:MAG TPA: sigma-54 dependent transcriptional regulator [Bryobacteraceae bacterium]
MRTDKTERTIVVGDDDSEVRRFLEVTLRYQGYGVELAEDGDAVLDRLQSVGQVSAVLLDLFMDRKGGMETLREIRRTDQKLPVIMLSGASGPENVVEAMKAGATDFLGKPLGPEELRAVMEKALAHNSPPLEKPAPRERSRGAAARNPFGEWSASMRELHKLAAAIGPSETPALIQGETGAGKEVLARYLHALSKRSHKPFLKLNCAALPSELVESELFGYERGAFTGAFQRKPGMFEIADGGTLLLDEIGDMDFKLQAKLLQVLQDHEFQRLGGKETVQVDVRVIAATHNDLEKMIVAGKFRQDLFYRLNVVTLNVPPLRERKEDILPLMKILLERHAPEKADGFEIAPALQQAMLLHDWPGNVRELENVVRKFAVLGDQDLIAADLSSRTARKNLNRVPVLNVGSPEAVEISAPIFEQVTRAKHQAETEAILAVLTSTQWNRKRAAALLKIDYKALLYKMKKLGIEDKMAVMPD